jgi:ABC-2 type transport system ATP-binding protein
MSAIRIEGLTKDYSVGFWRRRNYRALDDLSLDIQAGEVFGFLGPNGAGKTTTLKLLMQLIFPTSGRAEILGRPVGDVAARQRIGYLPENPYFYDYLTAEELLTYFAHLFGYSTADAKKRAANLLDRVGIGEERRRQQLRKFSKGMVQRVGIAQALLNDPEVIFLDEPMSGLDPLGRREVRSLILELRDQGRTVFFSSHILADAEALCSRVAVVAGGRLAAAGRLTDMLAFQVRGWELVVANLRPDVVARLGSRVTQATEISKDRYALELPLTEPPERMLAELVATGATLVSLNPVRDTLEDFFVRRVAEVGDARGQERLRPERGAKSPSESERGWGPASTEKRNHAHD